jgi:hypothetical protein
MKVEIQTANRVWMVKRRGSVDVVERKYGHYGKSERGEEQFLATGVEGEAHARPGDFVQAKKREVDASKPAQFVLTYIALNHQTGEVRLAERKVSRGRFNRGIYEFRYVDEAGKQLAVHRDSRGRFRPGIVRYMRKRTKEEGTEEGSAIELQSEEGGFIEFETPKWHRTWPELERRIAEAVKITKDMENAPEVADPNLFSAVHDRAADLKKRKKWRGADGIGTLHEWPEHIKADVPVTRSGGRLLVEIVPGKGGTEWWARLQVSESIALQEFESLLAEHETPARVIAARDKAQTIFDTLKPANGSARKEFEDEHANLKSFLQLIVYYILEGQAFPGAPKPAKFAFTLMNRTSFYSIYHLLLDGTERGLYDKLVKDGAIAAALTLSGSDRVLKKGYGDVRANSRLNPTIGDWLKSIKTGRHPDKTRKTDLLSPLVGGSEAMGRFPAERPGSETKHSGLIRFEVRSSHRHWLRAPSDRSQANDQPRDKWVPYVKKVFESAHAQRSRRPGLSANDRAANRLLDAIEARRRTKSKK